MLRPKPKGCDELPADVVLVVSLVMVADVDEESPDIDKGRLTVASCIEVRYRCALELPENVSSLAGASAGNDGRVFS